MSDDISKFLGARSIEEVTEKTDIVEYVPSNVQEFSEEIDAKREEDFDEARTTLKNILEEGQEALAEMFNIAKQSQNPIAYEKLGSFIASMTAVSKTLMDIHVKKKAVDKVEAENPKLKDPDSQVHNHNHIHVGSTDELARLIESMKNGNNQ